MGDAQVAFGILSHCFVQWPLYLLQYIPPSYTFIKSLISFDSSFLQVFGHLLTSQNAPSMYVCFYNIFKMCSKLNANKM
jgi:hypothetical protein